ncbi:MAG: ferrous iron transport protein A [Planctomycetota bacterium]
MSPTHVTAESTLPNRAGPSTTSPRAVPVALSELPVGQCGQLGDWSFDGRDADYLRALGLTPGSELRVCKQGEPCIVQVHRTRLGLANAVARRIFAVLTPPAAAASASSDS